MSDEEVIAEQPKSSVARNVFSNWAGHFVFMVSGFILPRVIGDQAGQEVLGLWDLGWSLVVYTSLLSLDISGAVNRYVARYRAVGDWRALNVAVNTSIVLLVFSLAVGVAAAFGFAALVPGFLPAESTHRADAQLMVLFLGLSAAIQLPASAFRGVISGFERFDLKNGIRVVVHIAELSALLTLLLTGHGLVSLAVVMLCGSVVGGILNWYGARRVCPQLSINPLMASRSSAGELMSFGGKSVLQGMSRAGLYQANGIILAYFVGPAALAVYSRQRALVTHAMRFLNQYANVFIPITSRLDAQEKWGELRDTVTRSTRYAFYMALPIAAILLFMGDPLVRLWMGDTYVATAVLTILTVGHLLPLMQTPTYAALLGMHKHAVPAVVELIGAVVSIGLGLLFVGVLNWGMMGAALAVAIPVAVGTGIVIPLWAFRVLDIRLGEYLARTLPAPLLANVPLVAWLIVVRYLLPDVGHHAVLGLGLGGGLAVEGLIYWRWVVPASLKRRLVKRLGRLAKRSRGVEGRTVSP